MVVLVDVAVVVVVVTFSRCVKVATVVVIDFMCV